MQAPIDREALAREYLPRGIRLSRMLTRRHPQHRDEAESVAIAATAEALEGYRPEVGDEFDSWAYRYVETRVLDLITSERPKGHGGRNCKPLATDRLPILFSILERWSADSNWSFYGESRLNDLQFADDGDPVGWEIEAEDEIKALSRRLPPRHGEAIRCRYLNADAATPTGCAARMGLGVARAVQLHREALEMLRRQAGNHEEAA
jgi:DNA-directed RNA polymerase specialized sigma subunit